MKRLLLDTNILLGLTRKAPWARWAYHHYEMESPDCMVFTSVICKGEILALAEKRGWERKKRSSMENVLREFPTTDLDRTEIVHAYAGLDAWTHGKAPANPENFPPLPFPAVSMSQNDLWIAATTRATKAKLLTTDKDFDHLKDHWIDVDWVDQKRI